MQHMTYFIMTADLAHQIEVFDEKKFMAESMGNFSVGASVNEVSRNDS
jgi:hypothetical protein